jgi:hypothetical protein
VLRYRYGQTHARTAGYVRTYHLQYFSSKITSILCHFISTSYCHSFFSSFRCDDFFIFLFILILSSGKCSETCGALKASVFKSYLTANSSVSAANTDISNLSSGNTTSSTSLQTMKQLICCVDGSQFSNFDTSFDSQEDFIKLPQVEYSGLGFLHPLKAHTGDLFTMLLSALSPLDMEEAMVVMVEREKSQKSIYPDAMSLDKSLTLTQITGNNFIYFHYSITINLYVQYDSYFLFFNAHCYIFLFFFCRYHLLVLS